MRLHPPNYSHILFNIHTYLVKLQNSLNDVILFNVWPWASWALTFLGLGFGLGPHLLKRVIRRTLNDVALVHSSY